MKTVVFLCLAVVATYGKVHHTHPDLTGLTWDVGAYLDVELHVGDSISFLTEWRAHDLLWTNNAQNVDKQWYSTCNTDAIVASNNWKKFSCDCPALDPTFSLGGLDACKHKTGTLNKICGGASQVFPNTFVPIVTPEVFTFTAPGKYYFVCSAAGGMHCMGGMKFRVVVDKDRRKHPITIPAPLDTHQNIWSFFHYPDKTIEKGDQIRFIYDAEHNVGVWTGPNPPVFPAACDDSANWQLVGDNAAGAGPNGFLTAPIQQTSWFSCRVPGHCHIGMVFKATVKSSHGKGKGEGEGESSSEGEGEHGKDKKGEGEGEHHH